MAEFLKTPAGDHQVMQLFTDLAIAFLQKGIYVDPDPEFGALADEYFGLNLDDIALGVNLGFMQISFEPRGWKVLVPQSTQGIRALHALAEIVDQPIDGAKVGTWDANYACHTYFFPN